MNDAEKQIENRLSILYAIQKLGKVASLDSIQSLFLNVFNLSQTEWQQMLNDITGSQLIRNNQKELFLSDNGMVVMSFFQDRLPLDTMERIDHWIAQSKSATLKEWQHWYDDAHQMLHLMLLEDNVRTFYLQLSCTRTVYNTMRFDDHEQLLELIQKQLIQK